MGASLLQPQKMAKASKMNKKEKIDDVLAFSWQFGFG